jgi:replication initiation protein RepC
MPISSIPTTSFGRRPVSLSQIANQMKVQRAIDAADKPGSNAPAAINKWHLFRTLTEIRERLGVSDRALSVLNALLSFHQETALTLPKPLNAASAGDDDAESHDMLAASEGEGGSCDLVVFPSNRSLAQRAHGMAGTTLWRHLTALVEAGLILRRDSPNGKRYARRSATGAGFSDAFGFDLTPLITRAAEFEALAEELRVLQRRRRVLKERISLHRRDVGKLIACGLDEGLQGDWEGYRQRYMGLMTPLRRLKHDGDVTALEAELARLRSDVTKALESHVNAQNLQSNALQNAMHQSNSKPQSPNDFEPASKEVGGEPDASASEDNSDLDAIETKTYPLGMVMEACPDVREFAPAGHVKTWSDFMAAAGVIRPMIGISPDAWREAQQALGKAEAHVVVAIILQRSIHSSEAQTRSGSTPGSTAVTVNGSPAILSAGGYLRALTDKARAGEFALGPVLMALIGQRLKARRAQV